VLVAGGDRRLFVGGLRQHRWVPASPKAFFVVSASKKVERELMRQQGSLQKLLDMPQACGP